MDKKEKKEVKEIVEEVVKETKKEEKKSKKKIIIISSIIGGLLLIAAIVFFLLFIFKPTYKVTVNTNGKKLIKDIVVEDNTIKSLPEVELGKNEYLVAWVTDTGEAIRPGIPLDGNLPIEPIIGDPTKDMVTINFHTGTPEVIESIKINKGSGIILPYKPNNYNDWKFLYWVDKDEYIVLIGTKLDHDLDVYAYWWKPEAGGTSKEVVTISFDTGTDEKLDDVKVPIGNKYIFRTPEKQKEGKKFKGWLDDKGNLLDGESKVEKAITLKAKWVDPYTCPENCTPNEDGSKCTRKTTVAPSAQEKCPADTYVDDFGNTFCVDTVHFDQMLDCARQCSDGYPFGDDEVSMPITREGLASVCCVKKVNYVTEYTCPEGYERDGDNCTLTETIDCTAN